MAPEHCAAAEQVAGRPALLRAVRPNSIDLSPLSLRRAVQQQQWLNYQHQEQQDQGARTLPGAAFIAEAARGQQLQQRWSVEKDDLLQPHCDQHNMPAEPAGFSSQWLPQPIIGTAGAPTGHPMAKSAAACPPDAAANAAANALAAYEQANRMLNQLHFERLKRLPQSDLNELVI